MSHITRNPWKSLEIIGNRHSNQCLRSFKSFQTSPFKQVSFKKWEKKLKMLRYTSRFRSALFERMVTEYLFSSRKLLCALWEPRSEVLRVTSESCFYEPLLRAALKAAIRGALKGARKLEQRNVYFRPIFHLFKTIQERSIECILNKWALSLRRAAKLFVWWPQRTRIDGHH